MQMKITGAPCCWGVDDVKNPYLPPWQKVLYEAGQAGYSAIELGPYGYLPLDLDILEAELEKNGIGIVAGTIFDDLVSAEHHADVLRQVDEICAVITKLPKLETLQGQRYDAPYLTVMDWGHDARDYAAGHSERAPRLSQEDWARMVAHIREISAKARTWGVRAVVHPHAGGYIEFADEIDCLMAELGAEEVGLCLDTGHLAYSGMNPSAWLLKYRDRLDYVHFKDIDEKIYKEVLSENIRFFEACGKGAMCPIGKGMLDYPEIYRVLKDQVQYAGYITVEQERDPRNAETSLRDVKESVDYLKQLGFA